MAHEDLIRISTQVRRDIIRMITAAGSGHPGGSLSCTDIMTALYFKVMKHNPQNWSRNASDQDAFILSAGHLAPVYYSVLARSGYFPIGEMATLRKFGSRLQGHPSIATNLPGVFMPSGSLGQGLSVAAGIALSAKMDGNSRKAFVLCGDGESEEGQIWEAAIFAAHHKLDNLVAMTDCNNAQIDGKVEDVAGLENLNDMWASFGWDVIIADGHDFDSILTAFEMAGKADGKPKMILFRTSMGHGVDFMEGLYGWHGKAPSKEQCEQALAQLEETLGDY